MKPAMTTAAIAQRLYYDSAILEFAAQVTDIRLVSTEKNKEASHLWQVSLDRTAFYPEGGGQPWDTGTLTAVSRSGAQLEVPVERVEEDSTGEVWHYIRKPLVSGASVSGAVDPDRRSDHEQQHSGQHLLSAIFLRELNARTVSFHLGAETSTIDLALVEGPDNIPGKLSEADLQHVEETANRVVLECRPLSTHWVERPLAEQMLARGDLRKLPDREGPIRIVQMQGIEFNACGGTHVSNTGAIGAILLRRIEKVRQGWRVEFLCGLRALRAARHDYTLLDTVARTLTVSRNDVPSRVEKILEDRKAAAKEIKKLTQDLASRR
jgi:alanyl-tRNA synthetase